MTVQSPYDGPAKEHWHLDKKVPLGIILAMLAQFTGGLWFVSKLDARIYALETNAVMQRERDQRQDDASQAARGEVLRRLETMDAKLDRLIEKGTRR